MPGWVSPMLATLTAQPFSGEGWIFEPKLDGIRCIAARNGRSVELYSRNRILLNGTYPELIGPLEKQAPRSYILDGEVVALAKGVSSFSQLQRRMQVRDPKEAARRGVAICYYIFDLLYLNGRDLRKLPLLERKNLLEVSFRFHGPLRLTGHTTGNGEAFFKKACRLRWEGILAKRAESVYVSKRSRDWLKIRCSAEQEFVIGGFTDPQGARTGLGALLLGYYDKGRFLYAGKVGTGFDTRTLNELKRKLGPLETPESPFGDFKSKRKGVHWVKPKLLAQISFTEWTHENRLRHPTFRGLRSDKDPREVVRERPA